MEEKNMRQTVKKNTHIKNTNASQRFSIRSHAARGRGTGDPAHGPVRPPARGTRPGPRGPARQTRPATRVRSETARSGPTIGDSGQPATRRHPRATTSERRPLGGAQVWSTLTGVHHLSRVLWEAAG
ncbi:MAG: hypothetical protein AAF471_09505 [Myxococcota bacterium]